MTAATARWHDGWRDWRNRRLADDAFRRAASRFALTRPLARRQAARLFDLVAGFVYSQWLLAAVELGVFDKLAAGPLDAPTLAAQGRLPLESAHRLLEALVSLELAEVRARDAAESAAYTLGPLGAALIGNPAVLAMVRHHRDLYPDLADPVALLRAGRGEGALSRYWAYAGGHADGQRPGQLDGAVARPYSALMAVSVPLVAGQVLDAYPIRRHAHLLDIGGGEGVFALAAAERAPRLQVTVFDLPAVAEVARERIARSPYADRVQAIGGDFHRDGLPGGADVVSLVRVIYDHDDAPAMALLRAARRALRPGGTLLLAEPLAGTAGAERMGAAYFGMYLLAMGSGRPRSAAQLAAMLDAAGFDRVRERRTALPLQAGLLVARAA
jgi:demethylspheroidene O-methyltransferase